MCFTIILNMKNSISINKKIKDKIFSIRGTKVMLASDLAKLYNLKTKRLNEQVKRNIDRFPKDFMFQLTETEKKKLVAKCDHLSSLKFSSNLPFVFTEHGVAALSGVLNSKKAIQINIQVIRAFVYMHKFISKNANIFARLDNVERKQIEYQIKTDSKFDKIFKAIEGDKIKQGIFYNGQIFDAYTFVSNLIKSASKSIVLIDNYVDETTLMLLTKSNIRIIIYTKSINKLDLEKYESQYSKITIKKFTKSHDRFLIIDNKTVYHFGASLKELGKKWFAFSKFDINASELLNKLK